ncbi:Gfo/Idh/MocA family protein [Dyadobacter jiangsuensis]
MKNHKETELSSSRRAFIKNVTTGAAVASFGGVLSAYTPKSYRNIIGANEKVRVALMGVNSRGFALANNFAALPNCEVASVCDVDSRATVKCIASVEKIQNSTPASQEDFRKVLEDKNVDALVVAAPDHWHAPAAILASKAGKHVYLEKPASHNPHEGELLVAAAKKYGNIIQLGTQRRSWPNIIQAMAEMKAGIIGRPYFAKGWYTNNRESIGKGKITQPPSWLNYELWQGPAPRKDFRDNLVHYHWHWFWHWGTGEALNNGTHTIDLMRWGLDVDYPVRVTSAGGRYRYQDDWETPDTQVINVEFANNTAMTWEGRSCNGRYVEGSSGGIVFYGDSGALQIDGANSYKVFDLDNKLIKSAENDFAVKPLDKMSPSQTLDAIHLQNFLDAIRKGTALHAGILGGHQSTLLCQLGNIALRCGGTLNINPVNGNIENNNNAAKLWKREYQKGWEPTV